MADQSAAMTATVTPIGIDSHNNAAFIEGLFAGCGVDQFIRELTQNSMDAIGRYQQIEPGFQGTIIWDDDEIYAAHFVASGHSPVYKLSITDNGDGMSPEKLVDYPANLAASSARVDLGEHHGLGAKISTCPPSPDGVWWQSWQSGNGYSVMVKKSGSAYGLVNWGKDGERGTCMTMLRHWQPREIAEYGGHGTKVVLMGRSPDHHTIYGLNPKRRWPQLHILRELNTRYFRIAGGIRILAPDSWSPSGKRLRAVTGQEAYLHGHSAARGTIKITGAAVHWWILRDDVAQRDNHRHNSTRHIAVLHENELYDRQVGINARMRLDMFGIPLYDDRVVVYVEPDKTLDIVPNSARSHLHVRTHSDPPQLEDLPWMEWGAAFRDRMPAEIHNREQGLVQRLVDPASQRRIHGALLQHYSDVYGLAPGVDSDGGLTVDVVRDNTGRVVGVPRRRAVHTAGETPAAGGTGAQQSDGVEPRPRRERPDRGQESSVHSQAAHPTTITPIEESAIPQVMWLSARDGSADTTQFDGWAAMYGPETRAIAINGDYPYITQLITHCVTVFSHVPQQVVEEVARTWIAVGLVDTVLKTLALPNGLQLLGPEHLTAAANGQYLVGSRIMSELTGLHGPPHAARPAMLEEAVSL